VPFAAASSEHPLPTHAVGEAAGAVLEAVGPGADLAVLFVTAPLAGALDDLAGAVRALLRPGHLLGATAAAVVAGERGVEDRAALALWAGHLAGGVAPVRLRVEDGDGGRRLTGLTDEASTARSLLLLADPFSFPVGAALGGLATRVPDLTVIGGLASAGHRPGTNRLVLDGDIADDGAVGVLLDADVAPTTVVSQGCRPIGQPFIVTRSDGNVLLELAGRPALERLLEVVEALDPAERALAGEGLHCGIVADEHLLDFGRGDFLVRTVMGADRERGAVAVGEVVPVGATVQFQLRDPATAGDDLRALVGADLARSGPAGGVLLFTCSGRGSAMFGDPHHDAAAVRSATGAVPLAGMFCAGELGPVGRRNALHGFTASLAVFRDPDHHPGGAE
jgi:small ligand-binding sensory domain FIST